MMPLDCYSSDCSCCISLVWEHLQGHWKTCLDRTVSPTFAQCESAFCNGHISIERVAEYWQQLNYSGVAWGLQYWETPPCCKDNSLLSVDWSAIWIIDTYKSLVTFSILLSQFFAFPPEHQLWRLFLCPPSLCSLWATLGKVTFGWAHWVVLSMERNLSVYNHLWPISLVHSPFLIYQQIQ